MQRYPDDTLIRPSYLRRTVLRASPSSEIARKTRKTVPPAAARLIDVFRASTVDRHRPHANEMMFFWRYIPGDDLQDLMWRLRVLVTPAASERIV